MELKDVSTKELVEAIETREGVRIMNIGKGENYKIIAAGGDGSKERYIKQPGSAMILFISENSEKN